MTEPYNLPSAKVVNVLVADDVVTTTIEISNESYLGYPIAPADLRRPKTHEGLWEFHQLVERDGPRLVFETYRPVQAPPEPGGAYGAGKVRIMTSKCRYFLKKLNWRRCELPSNYRIHPAASGRG